MRNLACLLVLVLVLSVCGGPTQARAQLAVADAPVLAAVGSAVTALKAILDETRKQLEELTNWPQVVAQLQAIAQLTTDLEALAVEVERINDGWGELSGSGRALCSIDEAVRWKGQALQWQQEGFAVVRTAQRVLGRGLAVLIDLQVVLTGIVGPTSGAQSTSALLAVIASQMQQLQGLTASFQSAALGQDMIESVVGIHLVCIQNHLYDGWGSYSR